MSFIYFRYMYDESVKYIVTYKILNLNLKLFLFAIFIHFIVFIFFSVSKYDLVTKLYERIPDKLVFANG